MQRFDVQFHAVGFGVWEEGRDAVLDLLAGFCQGLCGIGTADEHDHGGSEGGGLVDGALVVFNGFGAFLGIDARKEAASTKGGDFQGVIFDDLGGFFQGDALEDISPNGDVRNADCRVVLAALLERPRLRGHGMDAEAFEHDRGNV